MAIKRFESDIIINGAISIKGGGLSQFLKADGSLDGNSYEIAFGKNNAFNKNFGTSAGTVAQGNDVRINNGQTAFGWGNHVGQYLPLSGGNLSGKITFNTNNIDNGFLWNVNSDQAGITFKNSGDGDTNSNLNFFTKDNGNEYFKFSHTTWNAGALDYLDIKNRSVRANGELYANALQSGDVALGTNALVGGSLVWHAGNLINLNQLTTRSYSDLQNIPSTFAPSAHTHTKSEVGLGNVDNTADANKSVSYAISAGSAPNAYNANPRYNVDSGEDNGIRFWSSPTYSIAMGATSGTYRHGDVSEYSMKFSMGGGAGRGFTWGQFGSKPIASMNATTGNFKTDGTIDSLGNITAPRYFLTTGGIYSSNLTSGNTQVLNAVGGIVYFGNPNTTVQLESNQPIKAFRSGSNYTVYDSGNFVAGTNYQTPQTTLSGYGITDRISRLVVNSAYQANTKNKWHKVANIAMGAFNGVSATYSIEGGADHPGTVTFTIGTRIDNAGLLSDFYVNIINISDKGRVGAIEGDIVIQKPLAGDMFVDIWIKNPGPYRSFALYELSRGQQGIFTYYDGVVGIDTKPTGAQEVLSTFISTSATNGYFSGNVGIGTATDAGYKLDVNGKFRTKDGNAYATFDTASGLTLHSDGGGGDWTTTLSAAYGPNLLVGGGSSAIFAGSLLGLGRDIVVSGGTGWKTIIGNNIQSQSSGTGISTLISPTVSQTATAGISVLRISPFLSTGGSGKNLLLDIGTNTASNGSGTHSTNFSVNTLGQVDVISTFNQFHAGTNASTGFFVNSTESTFNRNVTVNGISVVINDNGDTISMIRGVGGAASSIGTSNTSGNKTLNLVAGTTAMTLFSTGNVSIGALIDNGSRFEVTGNSRFNGVVISTSGFSGNLNTNGGELRLDTSTLKLKNTYAVAWSSTSDSNGAKDTGLRRNSAGVLEVYDGITNTGLDANRRDLLVRNISALGGTSTQWNTAFEWGDHALAGYLTAETDSQSLSWVDTTNTLSISNGNSVEITGFADVGHDHTFASLTARPTTLSGYGITDTPWTSYLPLAGGTLTGDLNISNGESGGIHFRGGTGARMTSVSSTDVVFLGTREIRLSDSTSWDWNSWGGISYINSAKVMYIGGMAGSKFTSNASPAPITIDMTLVNAGVTSVSADTFIGSLIGNVNGTATPNNDSNLVHRTGDEAIYNIKNFADKIRIKNEILGQGGSSAALQVNGFQRTGNIYLHAGGNAPDGSRTGDVISNEAGVLTWLGVGSGTVLTSGNFVAGTESVNYAVGNDSRINNGQTAFESLPSYLPLIGGTITGDFRVNGNTTLNGATNNIYSTVATNIGSPTGSFQGGLINYASAPGVDFDITYTRTSQAVWKHKFVNQTMEWRNNANLIVFHGNNAGEVGIGVVPQSGFKLDVAGSTVTRGDVYLSGALRYFGIGDFNLATGGVRDLVITTNNEKVRIKGDTGNVGIGTTAPSEKLEVLSTLATGSWLKINPSAPGRESGIKIRQSTTYGADIYFNDAVGTDKGIKIDYVNVDTRYNALFITPSTNPSVGLGTYTPTEKLEVVGNVKATNFYGNLVGNVIGTSSKVVVSNHISNNIEYNPVWENTAGTLYYSSDKYKYNPSLGRLTATTFKGALNGNADTATNIAWSGVTSTPTTLSGYGITDANYQVGVGRWIAKVYSATGTRIAPQLSDLVSRPLINSYLRDDTKTFSESTDSYIAHYHTNVYVTETTAISLIVGHDDGGTIMVNGVAVYLNPNTSTGNQFIMNLRKGWNSIDLLLWEGAGGDFFSLDKLLSSLVVDMNCNMQWMYTSSDIKFELSEKENKFTKNTGFNKSFGTGSGTVAEGNDQRILNGQSAFTSLASYLPLSGGLMSGTIARSTSVAGYQVGSYNIATNDLKSNPIYTIGTSYIPSDTTLGNMFGIGYTHASASFINSTDLGATPSAWGQYVAAGGKAKIFFEANNGNIYAKNNIYAQDGVFRGNISALGGTSTGWNSAFGWGNHASAGYYSTALISAAKSYINVSTFTVPASMPESWIRVYSGSGLKLLSLHIKTDYDNTGSIEEIKATVSGYGMFHHLKSTTSDYNASRLLEVKTTDLQNGIAEIWIRIGASTAAGTVRVSSSESIPTLAIATPVFSGSNAVSLVYTNRRTNSMLITRGIEIDGNKVLHDGNTSPNDLLGLATFTKSIQLTKDWQDVGIGGTDLATGTFAVSIECNDYPVGGNFSMGYSGMAYIYSGGTNDSNAHEIVLHGSGHASLDKALFVRVKLNPAGRIAIQISANYATTGVSNYTFKFRKLI